jgi:hypothetical protein
MEWKKYKRPRKAKINKRDSLAREYRVYTITCPFCHTKMQSDFHDVLMMECWKCHNAIDLRDKNGKRAYE